MHAPPTPATLRLLACAEAFGREEEGAVGHEDWPALAALLDRELAVLTRLAGEAPARDPDLEARATALADRYRRLEDVVTAAQTRVARELAELGSAARRARAVQGAYARS